MHVKARPRQRVEERPDLTRDLESANHTAWGMCGLTSGSSNMLLESASTPDVTGGCYRLPLH
jgi:hypothetical protein